MEPRAPLLRLEHLTKRFFGVHALEDVSFDVRPGTIHAVVGANGAGKSTLMKLLVGVHSPDGGRILLDGHPVALEGPGAARRLGIDIVFQEIELAPNLTVGEGIFLAREPRRWGMVDYAAIGRRSRDLLASLGVAIEPELRVEQLSVAEKQLVQIARALAGATRLLILDEPTSALTDHEAGRLFLILEGLRRRGTTLLYVSHKLDEVFRLAVTVTVLRDGRHAGTFPRAALDAGRLIRLMVGSPEDGETGRRGDGETGRRGDAETRGRGEEASSDGCSGVQVFGCSGPADDRQPPTPDARRETRDAAQHLNTRTPEHLNTPFPVLLAVRGLTREPAFREVSFEVRRGEVLGLFGIVGAGRSEVARAIFGLDPPDAGEIAVEGRPARFGSPAEAVAAGIGLVPEDRKLQGLILEMSLERNLSLAALRRLARAGFLPPAAEWRLAVEAVGRLGIVTAGVEQEVRELSGGNQQKAVIAKWLATAPRLLILDEPTKGIDVAAKRELHALVRRLAADGMGVLLISSELDEALALSDRLLVLHEGRLTGAFDPRSASREEVLRAAVA